MSSYGSSGGLVSAARSAFTSYNMWASPVESHAAEGVERLVSCMGKRSLYQTVIA